MFTAIRIAAHSRLIMQQSSLFNPASFEQKLASRYVGRTLIYKEEVESTMDIASQLVQEGTAHDGTVIIADSQTKGRGRKGRAWTQSKGQNLAFTVLFHVVGDFNELFKINFATPIAVALACKDEDKGNAPSQSVAKKIKFFKIVVLFWECPLAINWMKETIRQQNKLTNLLHRCSSGPQVA